MEEQVIIMLSFSFPSEKSVIWEKLADLMEL